MEGCLDGPGLNIVGRKVSFSSSPILEPIVDNMLESSLAFWRAVGVIAGVGACYISF